MPPYSYNPWSCPPPWLWGMQNNNNEMDIKTYFEIQELLDKKAKEKKDADSKKKHEPPRFTFLETLGLNFITLPIFGGMIYLTYKYFA